MLISSDIHVLQISTYIKLRLSSIYGSLKLCILNRTNIPSVKYDLGATEIYARLKILASVN